MMTVSNVPVPTLMITYEGRAYCDYSADAGTLILHDQMLGDITFSRNLPVTLLFKDLTSNAERVGSIDEILTLLQK